MGSPPTYTGRSPASIGRDLDRWAGCGLEGLADKTAPGNPTRITEEVKVFMEEKLAEERTWNATQLAEAIEGRFGAEARVGPEAIRQHLVAMGYSWKRTRYVPSKPPNPEEEREARDELESLKRGLGGRDHPEVPGPERGISLCLPPAYSCTMKGRANRHEVRTRWGKQGRINLIDTLRLGEGVELVEYRMLEGACRTGEVLGYLDALAEQAAREDRRVVVVLDNAPFHKAGAIRAARPGWEAKGLELYYLPAYCPHLNLIEGVWKRLKGFLMPRRFYDSLAELKQAVLSALRLLGAVELQC